MPLEGGQIAGLSGAATELLRELFNVQPIELGSQIPRLDVETTAENACDPAGPAPMSRANVDHAPSSLSHVRVPGIE